jgi:ribosomal protein L32
MADKPEVLQLTITSKKKKNPKRVEAGKRLAAISKIAKVRRGKENKLRHKVEAT